MIVYDEDSGRPLAKRAHVSVSAHFVREHANTMTATRKLTVFSVSLISLESNENTSVWSAERYNGKSSLVGHLTKELLMRICSKNSRFFSLEI